MSEFSDKEVIASWQLNAEPWVEAIDAQQIESRRLVTDQAIVNAIAALGVNSVLDIGCGEGWLTRRVAAMGMAATGIDAIPALIQRAEQLGGATYRVLAYDALSQAEFNSRFQLGVCNFSLIGKESVEQLFRAMPQVLCSGAYLLVQTLHPVASCGDMPYQDGWRAGSWQGFSDKFSRPAPWYFRTLESWQRLFEEFGFSFQLLAEPEHPATGKRLSAIMLGRLN